MENSDFQKLQIDYQYTIEQFKMLGEIRFKLLAFVPTLAGAAVALLTGKAAFETSLAVGILGFVVTIGITFYDIRNTQFYDATVHRAKWLEALLELPICTQDKSVGGLFNERPRNKLKFFGLVQIWHDRGLGIVYGASLGGWAYIIGDSSFRLAQFEEYYIALLIAFIIGFLCAWQYQRLSRSKKPVLNENLQLRVETRGTKT